MLTIITLTISSVLFALFLFRHQLFFASTKYNREVKDEGWNLNLSLGDYVENLLSSHDTLKQKISHDLVNRIYLINLDGEKISVKKMRTSNTLSRVLIQFFTRGPMWFLRHNSTENSTLAISSSPIQTAAVERKAILLDQNSVQLRVCSHKTECFDLNKKLMDSVLINIPLTQLPCENLSDEQRAQTFKQILKPMIDFVRGAGYLHYRQLITSDTDWNNKNFFEAVSGIGSVLNPILFRVRIRLAQTSINVTGPIPKTDLVIFEYRSNAFNKVQQNAQDNFETAKFRVLEAGLLARRQLQNLNSDINGMFEDTQEAIETSLSEINKVQAQSPEVHDKDRAIAKLLLETLKKMDILTIREALNHPLITTVNKFVKVSNQKYLGDVYNSLKTQISAAKLGIVTDQFKKCPGFEEFARKIHLHRYLYVFNHSIDTTTFPDDIGIRFEGNLLPWKEIEPKLQYDEEAKTFKGHYSMDGLVNYGLYDWKEFKPFYVEPQLPPPWGNRYLCEICSWIIDKPRISGDHSFVRLKTPQGEWYSVGQYVPSKLGRDRFMFPMSLKQSRFMSPDVSEFWNGKFTVISFEITPDQFQRMKAKIEADKRQQLHLYQVYHNNCTIWAKSILEIADINLPSSMSVADLIAPGLVAWGRKVNRWKYTPKWVKPLIKLGWTITINTLGLMLGSGMIHKQVKQNPDFGTTKPYIHTVNDILDPKKHISEHPFIIGDYVRRQVESWREGHIKILTEKKILLEKKLELALKEQNKSSIDLKQQSPSTIPLLNLSEPLLSPHIEVPEPNLTTPPLFSPEITTKRISPFSSPHLTPSLRGLTTVSQLQHQLQVLNNSIQDIHYALPDRFRKGSSNESTKSELKLDTSLLAALNHSGPPTPDYSQHAAAAATSYFTQKPGNSTPYFDK